LKKTLNSAVANAESQHDVRKENLQVLEVRVDEGPRLKRSKSRSRGSRAPIIKRTSHFTIVVGSE
jgi:large subunit ribosomal protein L22